MNNFKFLNLLPLLLLLVLLGSCSILKTGNPTAPTEQDEVEQPQELSCQEEYDECILAGGDSLQDCQSDLELCLSNADTVILSIRQLSKKESREFYESNKAVLDSLTERGIQLRDSLGIKN